MEGLILRLVLHNWQRKAFAFLTACVIWTLINHSISTTRVFTDVPIRVINISPERTIDGLQQDGRLKRRVSLTFTGDKDTLDRIDPSELEVILDARGRPDRWIPRITRHDVRSLNPEIDLAANLSKISYNDFVVHLSRIATDKIPIAILPPSGEAPTGYQFLDIWPRTLYHTVTGPEERIDELKHQGLTLMFDLSMITAAELDTLASAQEDLQTDEISFYVPGRWKQVAIPFLDDEMQEINDPDAQNLRIDFLRNEFLAIEWDVPIRLFFPPKTSRTHNPSTLRLATTESIKSQNGIMTLAVPLYARDVSRLFMEVIRDHIEIAIIVDSQNQDSFNWSIQFIDHKRLEDMYVTWLMPGHTTVKGLQPSKREQYLRERFRAYMQKFILYTNNQAALELIARPQGNLVNVQHLPQGG